MAENAKITQEELTSIQELVGMLRKGESAVGSLEIQKSNIIAEVAEVQSQLNAKRTELEEKYGQIEVNLETGEYTVVDSEKEE
jgi:hypothetical protein